MANQIIKIIITPEHFKQSSGFSSNTNCPLAIAIKEIYPNQFLSVSTDTVRLGDKEYKMKGWTESGGEIFTKYTAPDATQTVWGFIDNLCWKAKTSEEVPLFTVELKKQGYWK